MPIKRNKKGGNKSKFYNKARRWFSVGGRINVEGFNKVKFRNKVEFIEIETSKGQIKVIKPLGSALRINLERPIYAFESSEGKIIVVTKSMHRFKEGNNLMIKAYTVAEDGEKFFLKPLAVATANVSKKHKVAYMTNFQWLQGKQVDRVLKLAPEWLKGKGFGLFLDSLRHIELAKQGVRKWFANILNNPESRKFAELRGFRKITREEAELLVELIFGKTHLSNPNMIKRVREGYMVKDLMPVRRKRVSKKR